MSGEKNLKTLLSSMSPVLIDGEFVFLSFSEAHYGNHSELSPLAMFAEKEGMTLVVPKSKADKYNLGYESVFKAITLEIHSSLDAVGLTASFSTKLSEHRISANVIAGYYHDHIFVPTIEAENAMSALSELQIQ